MSCLFILDLMFGIDTFISKNKSVSKYFPKVAFISKNIDYFNTSPTDTTITSIFIFCHKNSQYAIQLVDLANNVFIIEKSIIYF